MVDYNNLDKDDLNLYDRATVFLSENSKDNESIKRVVKVLNEFWNGGA